METQAHREERRSAPSFAGTNSPFLHHAAAVAPLPHGRGSDWMQSPQISADRCSIVTQRPMGAFYSVTDRALHIVGEIAVEMVVSGPGCDREQESRASEAQADYSPA